MSGRLESLCHLFGIGLVCFDPDVKQLDTSIFELKAKAQRFTPDMFYVNDIIPAEIFKKLYQ